MLMYGNSERDQNYLWAVLHKGCSLWTDSRSLGRPHLGPPGLLLFHRATFPYQPKSHLAWSEAPRLSCEPCGLESQLCPLRAERPQVYHQTSVCLSFLVGCLTGLDNHPQDSVCQAADSCQLPSIQEVLPEGLAFSPHNARGARWDGSQVLFPRV